MASEGADRGDVAALPISGTIDNHTPAAENAILNIHYSVSFAADLIKDGCAERAFWDQTLSKQLSQKHIPCPECL
jgi:hypothetical protein